MQTIGILFVSGWSGFCWWCEMLNGLYAYLD